MRSNRLYCPKLTEGILILSAEESHHAATALRLRIGAEVILFDGVGAEATGRITQVDRGRVSVETESIRQRPFELSCKVTLGVAMGRSHRQSYLVEKCTELGVASIWPLVTQRSTARPEAPAVKRWLRRAIEAAKQSGRAWIPTIEAPMPLAGCVERVSEFGVAISADIGRPAAPFRTWLEQHAAVESMLVFIGPEGGWSEEERRLLADAGVTAIRFGPTVLRTETVAVAVCAAVAVYFHRGDAERAE